MSWYKSGTATFTNGSTAVIGSGTDWVTVSKAGEGVIGPDGRTYEIASITSATSLTLGFAYLGSTVSGASYSILPSQSYLRDLAAQAASLISTYASSTQTQAGAAQVKGAPVDADTVLLLDSANSGLLRKLSWASIKIALTTWFPSITPTFSGLTTTGGVNIATGQPISFGAPAGPGLGMYYENSTSMAHMYNLVGGTDVFTISPSTGKVTFPGKATFGTIVRSTATFPGALTVATDSTAGTVASTASIVLSNRNDAINGGMAGGIFMDTYRDVSPSHYTAGIWFTRLGISGGITGMSDIVFGADGNVSNGALPTERMRLTADGNLLVGQTSGGAKVSATQSGSSDIFRATLGSGGAAFQAAGTASAMTAGYFITSSGYAGSITCSGTNTIYTTSSDYRLKNNQAPLTSSGAFIDALEPKTWTWANDGSAGVGFIAHEFQAVSPSSVAGEKDETQVQEYEVTPATETESAVMGERTAPKYQSMQASSPEVIANMIAELKSLRLRVNALEAA